MKALALFLVMLTFPVLADERVIVPADQYPWSAVGRLNSSSGWCSGALIGPDLVLTAAHCLWNHRTRHQAVPEYLHFVAAWDRGEFLDASEVLSYQVAPGWSFANMDHYGPEAAANDWALVKLKKRLGEQVGWIALGQETAVGMTVATVGYGQDRKHVPTAHIACHITGRLAGGTWLHNCDAVHGDSGGPIMIWQDGQPRLVAIHVASLSGDGGRRGGAVGVADYLAAATKMGAAATSRPGPLSKPLDKELAAKLSGK